MKRLTDEQQNDIIARYQRGEQSKDIAIIHDIRDNSVARVLRRNGIERTKVKRLPQEQLDKAVNMYVKDKVSSEIIANMFDVDSNVIRRAIIKAGYEIRPATENKRRYIIDEKFFEIIDREANAYFLGFLYADGSLTTADRGNGIKLSLKEDDLAILETFSNLVYGFIKVKTDTHKDGRRYSRVNFYSKKMHADLIKLGCTPKKSFTIKFPSFDIVPEHLIHHFIRGFMDGDGCICITDEKRPRVDFTSTLEFLQGLSEYLISKLGIKFSKMGQRHPDRDTNTRNIQTSGFDNCRKLLDYLYTDATIFLERKKAKYDELLNQQNRHTSKKSNSYNDPNKYGTTYIPSINGHQLTKEYLSDLPQENKDALIEPLFEIYRENGFPYSTFDDDTLIKDFINLKNADLTKAINDDVLLPTNYSGTNVFKHFAHHFYEINEARYNRPSMLDTFNDDDLLRKVIRNRLDQNFSMTGNELKAGLANSKIAFKGSIFNAVLARYIYTQYTHENSIIYDYSMGFGQRLLAALTLPYHITYVGADPYDKTVKSNKSIFDFYNKNVPMLDKDVDLRCIGSEDFLDKQYVGKIDLAFSSPPYYNLEVYSDENTQAYSTSYVDFLHRYWRNTISNIDKMLSKDGRLVLNIIDTVDGFEVGKDMANVIREAGFELEREYKIQLSRNLEFGGKKDGHKYEPVYVFKRK